MNFSDSADFYNNPRYPKNSNHPRPDRHADPADWEDWWLNDYVANHKFDNYTPAGYQLEGGPVSVNMDNEYKIWHRPPAGYDLEGEPIRADKAQYRTINAHRPSGYQLEEPIYVDEVQRLKVPKSGRANVLKRIGGRVGSELLEAGGEIGGGLRGLGRGIAGGIGAAAGGLGAGAVGAGRGINAAAHGIGAAGRGIVNAGADAVGAALHGARGIGAGAAGIGRGIGGGLRWLGGGLMEYLKRFHPDGYYGNDQYGRKAKRPSDPNDPYGDRGNEPGGIPDMSPGTDKPDVDTGRPVGKQPASGTSGVVDMNGPQRPPTDFDLAYNEATKNGDMFFNWNGQDFFTGNISPEWVRQYESGSFNPEHIAAYKAWKAGLPADDLEAQDMVMDTGVMFPPYDPARPPRPETPWVLDEWEPSIAEDEYLMHGPPIPEESFYPPRPPRPETPWMLDDFETSIAEDEYADESFSAPPYREDPTIAGEYEAPLVAQERESQNLEKLWADAMEPPATSAQLRGRDLRAPDYTLAEQGIPQLEIEKAMQLGVDYGSTAIGAYHMGLSLLGLKNFLGGLRWGTKTYPPPQLPGHVNSRPIKLHGTAESDGVMIP